MKKFANGCSQLWRKIGMLRNLAAKVAGQRLASPKIAQHEVQERNVVISLDRGKMHAFSISNFPHGGNICMVIDYMQ